MKNNIKEKIILLEKILILIFIFSIPRAVYADPLSYALESWDPIGVCGNIMEPGRDYIIVNEKKVLIINEKRQGKLFKTSIMDLQDKQLGVEALKKGVYVAINGTRSMDKDQQYVVVAKEIYVLPKLMSGKEMKKYPKLQKPVESW
jgi:hypothetical protein